MQAGRFVSIVLLGAFLASGARADVKDVKKDVAKYQAKYASETNPVKRAKVVVKLGRAEYLAARQAVDSQDWNSALEIIQDYSNKATEVETALNQAGIDAEKHSNGFRQLQISVRESARQLRDITSRMPFQQRSRFRSVLHDLEKLNQKLLLELFPHQPKHHVAEKKDQSP